jgi:hypothetical protein
MLIYIKNVSTSRTESDGPAGASSPRTGTGPLSEIYMIDKSVSIITNIFSFKSLLDKRAI